MKKPKIKLLNQCRSCGGSKLERFLQLSDMPFTDEFIEINEAGSEFLENIDIYLCEDCLTAQTQKDVDVSEYYEDYQYSVGTSPTASRFFNLLAKNLKNSYYPGVSGKKVLEIGSGDGEQLLAFKETGCEVLGFEPSSVLCEVARSKGIKSVQGLFAEDSITSLPDAFQGVDVVMLSYTFDHLPQPRNFLATAKTILNKMDGLLVVEIHSLEKIVERQEFCLFEHEHTIYLTESTVSSICEMEGFDVISFNLIPEAHRRANSLIFVATPKGSILSKQSVRPQTPPVFSGQNFYTQISEKIYQGIANLDRFVNERTQEGKRIAGYGAGGRGIMTLAAMSNARKLKYLVDKNPRHSGLLTPGSHIPVVSIDELKNTPVDEILVFSFGYMEEIKSEIGALGYAPNQFHSLLDILAGRF
jgi:ubiquinone/menaquinone biosynthesis C-methylase UbiE